MPHNATTRHALTWLLVAAATVASPLAVAKKSDRNQAMDITAGKQQGSLDDATPTVLSGGVTIDQGTLHAEASRAEISTRGGEIARVVLSGGPARLNQQLDDGSPMSAVAEKVDYNPNTEMVVFTGNVTIKQPRGSLSGERVVYNMASGQVTSGGEGAGRVRMRILPKTGGGTAAPAPQESGNDEPQTNVDADGDASENAAEGG